MSIESTTVLLNGDRDFYQALTAVQKMTLMDPKSTSYKDQKALYIENSEQAFVRVNSATNLVIELIKNEEDQEFKDCFQYELNRFNENYTTWKSLIDKYLENYERTGVKEHLPGEVQFSDGRNAVDIIGEKIYELSILKISESKRMVRNTNTMQFVSAILILTISLMTTYVLSRIISEPLNDLANQISNMDQDDYETPIKWHNLKGFKEYVLLVQSIREMRTIQKLSYDEITNYKDNLESAVDFKTRELKSMNEELRATVDNLEITHNKLLESKKYEAINKLLMEIAHRINTPLGNAITTLSYLQNQSEELHTSLENQLLSKNEVLNNIKEMLDSIDFTQKSTNMTSLIISELKFITNEYEEYHLEHCTICSTINSLLKHVQSQSDMEIELDIKCDYEIDLLTYPQILIQVIKDLVGFSMCFKDIDSDILHLYLNVYSSKGNAVIEYHDENLINYDEHFGQVFEPYYFKSFKKGGHGIELNRAYNLVRNVLSGDLECGKEDTGNIFFTISLPFDFEV